MGGPGQPHPTLNKSNLYHTLHCVHGPANTGGGSNDAPRVTAIIISYLKTTGPSNISKIRIFKHKIFEIYKFKFHLLMLS